MAITLNISTSGVFMNNGSDNKPKREHKGKSLIAFPTDFTVLDLETTGLDPKYDDIIEIAALRIRNNVIVDSYSTLINPGYEIDEFITGLTGIANEMLSQAPKIEQVLPGVKAFLKDDIIIGHNVNFDINFLYDNFESVLNMPFTNDFVDTMRIARKTLPELSHHRLDDIATELNVSPALSHRALADCQKTFECFCKLYKHILSTKTIDEFIDSFKHKHGYKKLDLREITAENDSFDETHPLYCKRCVFTGTLEKMTRADAAQLVVNLGGICDNGITKKTNYLILGNNDYCKTIKDGKSSKQKKAEEYKLNGIDIEILPENVFYDMLEF